MNSATDFAKQLANDLTKITLADFFKEIHSRFYSDQDISFMNYFLELTEHENEFYVHHEKLIEYGIMTSNRSSALKDRLDQLMLIESEDYVLQDVLQNATGRPAKHYHLTPEAFKKCLMRAQRRSNQPVDPVIYCDYYLLLERIHKLYTDYERLYSEKLLSMKDDKIDRLEKKVDEQSKKMDEQSEEIRKLLGYANDTNNTLHEVQDELTETKEEVILAKTYLQEKSKTSTLNPSDERKHHYFAATTFINDNNEQVVKFVTGQREYVDKTIKKRVEEENHKVIIQPFYNANGIDLRQNVHERFMNFKKNRIKEINDIEKGLVKEANKQLLSDIKQYNESNVDNPRIYLDEKIHPNVVKSKDISVSFQKLSFIYGINPFIAFDEVLQLVIKVNNITQESPLQSENREDDVNEMQEPNV